MRKQPTVESVVFVIDDDASVRASLKSLFKSVGLYVELFGSADEFLKSQRPDAPSCLVLDVRLPGISGLEIQGGRDLQGTLCSQLNASISPTSKG
jgi:FixJ family two-component response regulator